VKIEMMVGSGEGGGIKITRECHYSTGAAGGGTIAPKSLSPISFFVFSLGLISEVGASMNEVMREKWAEGSLGWVFTNYIQMTFDRF